MIRTMTHTRPSSRRAAPRPVEPLEGRVLFAGGALDTGFGSGGIVAVDPTVFKGQIGAIAVQGDGSIVAVGRYEPLPFNGRYVAAVARFNAAGGLDTAFGGDGIVTLDGAGFGSQLTDVKVLTDGHIVAVGTTSTTPLATRLNANGSFDPTFGQGGVSMPNGVGLWPIVSLDVSPAGELFLAGRVNVPSHSVPPTPANNGPGVLKLTASGGLDTSFGDPNSRGAWVMPGAALTASSDQWLARDVKLQPDGRIVLAGDVPDGGTGPKLFVARLTTAGRPDPTFSGDGILRYDTDGAGTGSTANALAIQGDGKIVVAGAGRSSPSDRLNFRFVRLMPDGTFDLSFGGGGGRRAMSFDVGGVPDQVKILPDGKILAAGMGARPSRPSLVVGRITPGGDADLDFGTRGRVITPANVTTVYDMRQTDMDLTPGGGILVSSNHHVETVSDAPLFARYLSDAAPPPPPPPGDSVVLQAEDFAGGDARTIRASNNPGYTGSGFADFVADRDAVLRMDVGSLPGDGGPGDYLLEFRYANGSSSARSMNLTVGPDSTWQDRALSFAPTGSWSTWKTLSVPVTLRRLGTAADGEMVVVFNTTGQNGPNLDSMTVRAATAPPPPPPLLQLQAEQAALTGAKARSDNPGFTGSGYADYSNASGDSVEWTFDHPGGTRTLTFRYANGAATDRPLELRVNGNVVNSRLSFAPSGTWAQWRQVSVTVSLVSGTNRVKLTSIGNNGPNIDQVTVG